MPNVNLCKHIVHPFCQNGIKLTAKQKCLASLGLLFTPFLIFPGLFAFYGITFYFKNKAIKNCTGLKSSTSQSVGKNPIFSSVKTSSSSESIATPKPTSKHTPVKSQTIVPSSSSTKSAPIKSQTVVQPSATTSSVKSQHDLPKDLVEAIHNVLTTEGFETPPHVYPNYNDKNNLLDTVEEIQGTPELRKAARQACEKFPNAFSPEVLKKCRDANKDQYYMFKTKRLSHVFGVKGRIDLPNGKNINLEGFCEDFTIPMVISSFNNFCETYAAAYPWLTPKMVAWIEKKLLEVLTSDLIATQDVDALVGKIQKDSFKGPIAGGSGFDWHSTITAFIGKTSIICNRGAYSMTSGISFYSLEDKSFVTPDVLRDVSTRQNHTKTSFFGHNSMVSEVGGKQTTIIKMPAQEVGNCTYRSIEAYLFALMTFAYMKETDPAHFYENLNDKTKLEAAFEVVRPVFEAWVNHDRSIVFNDLAEDLATIGKGTKEYTLYKKLEGLVINTPAYKKMAAT